MPHMKKNFKTAAGFVLALAAALICTLPSVAAKPKFPFVDRAPFDTVIDGQKVVITH